MPAWLEKTPDGKKAWERAKKIVKDQYPGTDEKSDPEKFYALVTQITKSICKSEKYDCGDFPKMESMSEMLHRIQEASGSDVSDVKRISSEILSRMSKMMGTTNVYLHVQIDPKNDPRFEVSGNINKMAAFLVDQKDAEWKILGFSTDRNWARDKAEEV